MTFWKAALLALATLTACSDEKPATQSVPAEPVAEAPPKPAIWKISDADTTVYLFGTVHVLPPTLSWHSPAVDKALDEAKAVYFETDTEGDPMAFRDIIQRLGLYEPSERLSDRLSLEDLELLKGALAELELPLVALESMRPWYAGVVISEAVVRRAGYDVTSGVESVMRPAATAAGKQIRFLETVEEQMASFATLPEAVQIKFLVNGLAEIDAATGDLGALVNAWKAGDTDKLDDLLIEEDLAVIPELYDALLKNRNAKWIPKIDTLMKSESGTFLIAVGAAHLIGKDSVIEMLKPLGYSEERVQ